MKYLTWPVLLPYNNRAHQKNKKTDFYLLIELLSNVTDLFQLLFAENGAQRKTCISSLSNLHILESVAKIARNIPRSSICRRAIRRHKTHTPTHIHAHKVKTATSITQHQRARLEQPPSWTTVQSCGWVSNGLCPPTHSHPSPPLPHSDWMLPLSHSPTQHFLHYTRPRLTYSPAKRYILNAHGLTSYISAWCQYDLGETRSEDKDELPSETKSKLSNVEGITKVFVSEFVSVCVMVEWRCGACSDVSLAQTPRAGWPLI